VDKDVNEGRGESVVAVVVVVYRSRMSFDMTSLFCILIVVIYV